MGASPRQRLSAAERRRKALGLWLAAVDLRTIADQVGYASAGAAKNAIDRAIEESVAREHENIDEQRRAEVMRYDRLQAAHWGKALKGDPKSSDVVLKCIEGRERLRGLRAPTRVSLDAQQLGDEILTIIDELTGASGDDGGT
ncbi:hypothetical protein B0E38_01813 [Streptomyces sp. 111WW2]|uniref:hypothetical protein n=1 Tax=Streptomyces sp. 111WW2 TaxID=1945515 RepID=UPI000D0C7F7B|nr:hypothetical protein [Streptomyces sp. 111WW2]PSK57968.1 hypothetical protein B0E38_01813 [Streptomyces sp. 111WW2]